MFYTYAEKQTRGPFGDWRMRQVAFDTTRRYVYYSECLSSKEGLVATTGILNQGDSLVVAGRPGEVGTSSPPTPEPTPSHALQWSRKMKVSAVVPVATEMHVDLSDARTCEADLYQLEITGEERVMATGEMPPPGPLLYSEAGITTTERARCRLDNEDFLADPFFLTEIFNALRDQFENFAQERQARVEQAVLNGAAASLPQSRTATLESPRSSTTAAAASNSNSCGVKVVKVRLRCRDEREFRRFWYTLQTVLGYDKLITRPYRGLPPYDPRNSVAFAHVPMCVWHTFKSLDKAVFYVLCRGDLLGHAGIDGSNGAGGGDDGEEDKLSVILEGVYMCVTHDMVYFMRDRTGNIPHWLRMQDISDFHFNTTAEHPFISFLSDSPAGDVLFVSRPPVHGARAIQQYDPRFDVLRARKVVHDACFASLSIRRVVRIQESTDASATDFATRMRAARGRPLTLRATSNSALSCPLPKEQLAVVWEQVQTELRERPAAMREQQVAIPLYDTNAADVQLTEAQLGSVAQHLEEERERRDDIVGIPLDRARQIPPQRQQRSRGGEATGTRHGGHRGRGGRGGRHHDATTRGTDTSRLMTLTSESLNTPQIQGTGGAGESDGDARDSNSSSGIAIGVTGRAKSMEPGRGSAASSTVAASEYSSYLVPGTRYITHAEVEAGAVPRDVNVDQHVVMRTDASLRQASKPVGGGSTTVAGIAGPFRFGPECTVNDIVSRSMVAMESMSSTGGEKT